MDKLLTSKSILGEILIPRCSHMLIPSGRDKPLTLASILPLA